MPTYQYACTACDHRLDAVQSFSDASLTVCPVCSGSLRKVFSSVGIVFKGSGFYRTDSRVGAGSTVAAPAGENGSKSDNGSSGGDKSGGDKSRGDKSGGDKSGGDKKSESASGGKKSEKSTSSSSSGSAASAARS